MNDADAIWDLIDRSNAAWLSGRPRDTAELFHTHARLVAPGLAAVVEGRDDIVQTYVDMTTAMVTDHFEVTDRSLLVDGDVAVATYAFDIAYHADDGQHRERGQEILVLRSADEGWQAIWRTQVPLARDADSD